MGARLPLLELPEAVETRLRELGGRPINLYRVLANQPALLAAWVDFAWALRLGCATPRLLRELMIVRCAQLHGQEYERLHHQAMALAAGAGTDQIAELPAWRDSSLFSADQRAALALTEAVWAGDVDDATWSAVTGQFGEDESIELVLTAAFYSMVPKVLDALRVPLES